MACKYKYKNKWYSELEIKNQILRDISLNDIIVELSTQMSYTVEINIAKELPDTFLYDEATKGFDYNNIQYGEDIVNKKYWSIDESGNTKFITKEDYNKVKELTRKTTPSQHYSNLTVPGGTNYTENEISIPTITPSIKGHAQFSTDNGIGWFRGDDKKDENLDKKLQDLQDSHIRNEISYDEYIKKAKDLGIDNIEKYGEDVSKPTKTRRILEVQSDLFQKGREEVNLIQNNQMLNRDLLPVLKQAEDKLYKLKEEQSINDSQELVDKIKIQELFINNTKKSLEKNKERALLDKSNQFLQLLNKDNNWVTFFIRAIIQSTAKERIYEASLPDIEEKVLSLQKEGKLKIDCK